MKNQNEKLIRWIVGILMLYIFIYVFGAIIVDLLFGKHFEVFLFHYTFPLWLVLFLTLVVLLGKLVQSQSFIENYKYEELEKAKKELTSGFKKVLLNHSEPISKECFECQAKVDDDGKIVCQIQLDYEVKIESYEEFLRYFHFTQH